MAPIAILISSTIGFLTGLVQFAVYGVSLWQAFVTYFAVSCALSILALVAAIRSDYRIGMGKEVGTSGNSLENWQDWQTEEEMEAERVAEPAEYAAPAKGIRRKSA